MKYSRSRIFLFISSLIILSFACTLTGSRGESAEEAVGSIATSVAATQAAENTDPEATWPFQPVEAESPSEPDIIYQGVSFSFDDSLADTVNAEIIAGEGDAASEFWSTPEHRQFTFINWILVDAFHTPAIRIYPVAEFKAVNSIAGEGLDELMTAISTQADEENLLIVDLFNAAQFIRSQVNYIQFQNGMGVRYISQYGQAASPIGWPNLFFTFQGFTDDGLYYISAILPVNHPSLPHPNNVTMDDAFFDNFMTYADDMNQQLNGENPETFVPSLILIDEIIGSLSVQSP